MMHPFRKGDKVRVSGAAGVVDGEVMAASTPAELPDLGPGSASFDARQIMREFQIDFVVLIRHRHSNGEVCFFALHYPEGWKDLHKQDLSIGKIGETA